MDKPIIADNPPLIFQEINKLVETLDDHQQQRLNLEMLMDEKHTFFEELQQHEKTVKSNNASKHTSLTIATERQRAATDKNSYYRKNIDELCESINAAYERIYEISDNSNNTQEKLETMGKSAIKNLNRYDKEISELVTVFNQLKDKRKTDFEKLEIQMAEIGKENTGLGHTTTEYENVLQSYEDDHQDVAEEIEKELTDLQAKLSTSHEEYSAITEEARAIDTWNDEIADKHQKSAISELESQLSNIVLEVEQLCQHKDHQKTVEQKLTTFVQSLEDIENNLKDGLHFNDYSLRYLQLLQEIEEIRAYIGHNFKHSVGEEAYANSLELLKELDLNISNTITDVTQIATELNKIGDALESLKDSDDLLEKIQTITNRIDEIYKGKPVIRNSINAISDEIQNATEQLQEEGDKEELALLTFENTSLLEVKELNKQFAELQEIRIKLDDELKTLGNELKELEATRNVCRQEAELVSQKSKDLNSLIRFQTSAASSPQTHTKKAAAENSFTRPKTPESLKKRKSAPSPSIKSNWDSDSSMEGETVKLSDFLKTKHRKRTIDK